VNTCGLSTGEAELVVHLRELQQNTSKAA